MKKFKGSSGESSGGGLFSDPIRVSQVSQGQSGPSKTVAGSIGKGTHALQGGSPTPSGGGVSTVIEGKNH